jgi:hypothetical protein
MTPELPAPALAALKAGNKIEAIKQLRLATGLGLKEAKDWIEAHERGVPAASFSASHAGHHVQGGLSPGEVSRGGSAGKWLVLLIAVAAVAIGAALFLR